MNLRVRPCADGSLNEGKMARAIEMRHGVELKGTVRSDIKVTDYDGWPDQQAIDKLNRLIELGQFEVYVAHAYPLEEATEAHKALETHYLGKLSLRVH